MEWDQEDENNRCNQKIIPPTNPSHGSISSNDSTFNEEGWSIWISMQPVVFFEIIVCENQTFGLM